ncbi:MAG: hypothetical protein HZA54_03025 [Planctomycetes bacterium]|nr:hypothetical protein [Planctomycetota bacterium]
MLNHDPARRPPPERMRGLSLIEILILLIILGILFFVALPILRRSRILNHEATAISTLGLIRDQQVAYQQSMGKLGTLSDLALVNRIDPALATVPVAGYRYRLTLGATEAEGGGGAAGAGPHVEGGAGSGTWWCMAAPEAYGVTGERLFFVDQSGVMRARETGGADFETPETAVTWHAIKDE